MRCSKSPIAFFLPQICSGDQGTLRYRVSYSGHTIELNLSDLCIMDGYGPWLICHTWLSVFSGQFAPYYQKRLFSVHKARRGYTLLTRDHMACHNLHHWFSQVSSSKGWESDCRSSLWSFDWSKLPCQNLLFCGCRFHQSKYWQAWGLCGQEVFS